MSGGRRMTDTLDLKAAAALLHCHTETLRNDP